MTGRIPKSAFVLLSVSLIFVGCGDDDTAFATSAGAATTAAVDSTATPTTATAAPTTTAQPATSQPSAPVPAAEALDPFFAAAEELDQSIKAAADQFNATFDPDSGTVGAEATKVIFGLTAAPLKDLVSGGMDEGLEVAVLAVFADLDSRIAALMGGVEYGGDLDCLGFGGESARRFPLDLAAARSMAVAAAPLTAAADSPEAGMVAARLTYIEGSNSCCGSCGGYAYEESIAIDWENRIFGPGFINAPFVATFDGVSWQVDFPQAG